MQNKKQSNGPLGDLSVWHDAYHANNPKQPGSRGLFAGYGGAVIRDANAPTPFNPQGVAFPGLKRGRGSP